MVHQIAAFGAIGSIVNDGNSSRLQNLEGITGLNLFRAEPSISILVCQG